MVPDYTTEGNKLIAEFEGWTLNEETGKLPFVNLQNIVDGRLIQVPYLTSDGRVCSAFVRRFSYDVDWARLVPIIDKIRLMGFYIKITLEADEVSCIIGALGGDAKDLIVKQGRRAIWEAVVEFIKRHKATKRDSQVPIAPK